MNDLTIQQERSKMIIITNKSELSPEEKTSVKDEKVWRDASIPDSVLCEEHLNN